jgi:adenylate cyclase
MIARLRSWLASWTAAETAEGVPRPPPAPSLPPRVVDAAVVAVVAVLNAGYLLSSVYVHAARGGGRPQLGPGDWSLRAVLGTICLPAVAALWWRRDHPIGVLGIALAALVVAYPYPSLFAIVALYSAALRVPLRTALLAGAAAALCRIAGVATFRGSIEVDEVASALTTSAMAVAAGLYVAARRAYMARLKERALFARALASFLPPDVAKLVQASPSSLSLTAELEATVVFCDIRGFSAIAERLGPRQVAELIGRFSSAMAAVVADHGGLVDKFAGDAVMALFGVPNRTEDQAARAIRSAVAMQQRLAELNAEGWPGDLARLEVGIGINSGPMIAGTVGGAGRLEYTVIGDAINVAQRLESQATGGEILVSAATIAEARWERAEPAGERLLKGRNQPVEVFRITDRAPAQDRVVGSS